MKETIELRWESKKDLKFMIMGTLHPNTMTFKEITINAEIPDWVRTPTSRRDLAHLPKTV